MTLVVIGYTVIFEELSGYEVVDADTGNRYNLKISDVADGNKGIQNLWEQGFKRYFCKVADEFTFVPVKGLLDELKNIICDGACLDDFLSEARNEGLTEGAALVGVKGDEYIIYDYTTDSVYTVGGHVLMELIELMEVNVPDNFNLVLNNSGISKPIISSSYVDETGQSHVICDAFNISTLILDASYGEYIAEIDAPNIKKLIIDGTVKSIKLNEGRVKGKSKTKDALKSILTGTRLTNKTLKDIIIKHGVEVIGNCAMDGCVEIKSLYIPDSVKYIGTYAFCGCTGLECIKLPKGLKVITKSMLSGCSSLKKIDIPNNVIRIDERAFSSSSLEELIIPDSVKYIGEYAFDSCENLKYIRLPKSIRYIGKGAFSLCINLKKLEVPRDATIKISRDELGISIEAEIIKY